MCENSSLVGVTLRDRYKIQKPLGSGGFGCTYLAFDLDLPGKPACVVKHLVPKNPNPQVMNTAKRLFEREAETLHQLGKEHPQIPNLLAHFEENGNFFLVQEYIEGYDLTEEIISGRPISEEKVLQLLQEILEVLAFVHQKGVIHRDIKPQNIRRRQDGKIVLIDFGSVKSFTTLEMGANVENYQTIIGTKGYMPEEQMYSNPQYSSDVYAVGIIAFCCLTGLSAQYLPSNSKGELCFALFPQLANLNPGFVKVLDTMVRRYYHLRYNDASDALQALQRLQLQRPQLQRPQLQTFPGQTLPRQPEKVSIWERIFQFFGQLFSEEEVPLNNIPASSDYQKKLPGRPNLTTLEEEESRLQESPPPTPPKPTINHITQLPDTISTDNFPNNPIINSTNNLSTNPTTNIYIKRPHVETQCCEEILHPGALIRIKAPQKMGKTLLLEKILDSTRHHNYKIAKIDLKQAENSIIRDYKTFLQWLCVNITDSLEISVKIDDYWRDIYGLNRSCSRYLEYYLLPAIENPLVLALDNLERLFEYPDTFSQFCLLLRNWHESAKQNDRIGQTWKKLRLVMVHSTEVFINLDTNHSPFNVGTPIELSEFTPSQVETFASEYQLNGKVSTVGLEKLMELVGGHPYLIQQAFTNLKNREINMAQILNLAPTEQGIYRDYLRQLLWNVQQNPLLKEGYKKVVTSNEPVRLNSEIGFKLQSLGLVKIMVNNYIPSCNLYRQYFTEHL
jgi:serine/threonine protein kinase